MILKPCTKLAPGEAYIVFVLAYWAREISHRNLLRKNINLKTVTWQYCFSNMRVSCVLLTEVRAHKGTESGSRAILSP